MFLTNEALADTIAAYPDVVRLAIFGHTHSDEMRLLTPKALRTNAGVPLKIVASITPVNGNNPSFTLAAVDPTTATLVDYTVVMASNQTGIATTWAPEYTYSTAYGEAAFDGTALKGLIAKLSADPGAHSLESQVYLNGYAPHSGVGQMLQLVWPQYVCSMANDSAASFAACACPATK
jgi:sphingomyelin phosphodiesterase acid-like 3